MWKETDDFWLTLTGNKSESALLVILGDQPLRITATFDNDGKDVDREGHIDILITSFDRVSHTIHGNVVANDTGHNLSSRTLVVKTSEHPETDICQIEEITGIIF